MLGVAIDVGVKNMALCALRLGAPDSEPTLEAAAALVQSAEIVAWEVVALTPAENTFAARCASIAEYVSQRRSIFEGADFLVLEHQMQAPMRVVAGAVFSAVRMVSPVPFAFQLSRMKLAWPGVEAPTGYSARKKMAVQLVHRVVQDSSPEFQRLFGASTKKDDLADAMLHLLMFHLRKHGVSCKRKRKRAPPRSAEAPSQKSEGAVETPAVPAATVHKREKPSCA